jgi:hypothetical protein
MTLSGLHLLLSYKCTSECEHCFVWGSPFQEGTMTLQTIEKILKQGKELGTVESIYFEGGEPFLYYPVLVAGVRMAAKMGFEVGIVTNAYWATSTEDAHEWLRPFEGLVQDLSISSDLYHGDGDARIQCENARTAADRLAISTGIISIAQPEDQGSQKVMGQIPDGENAVMFRGRAAEKLAVRVAQQPWGGFAECPHEDLRDPGRVHIDPLGNVHICQGISIGNLFESSLEDICSKYDPELHPITGPLLAGGPSQLVRQYGPSHAETYADPCHLCYHTRLQLRTRFPDALAPDQMYGVINQ